MLLLLGTQLRSGPADTCKVVVKPRTGVGGWPLGGRLGGGGSGGWFGEDEQVVRLLELLDSERRSAGIGVGWARCLGGMSGA